MSGIEPLLMLAAAHSSQSWLLHVPWQVVMRLVWILFILEVDRVCFFVLFFFENHFVQNFYRILASFK